MMTLGYGLIGSGGNLLFVPAVWFTSLFKEQGIPYLLISGMFHLAGVVLMLLNISSLSLETFFHMHAALVLVMFVLVILIFPNSPFIVYS